MANTSSSAAARRTITLGCSKMKLLFLDCELRKQISRTKRISDAFLLEAGKRYEVEVVDIDALHWQPKTSKEVLDNAIPPVYEEMAKKVASCDLLVIGAPFYDMSIPAALKTFLERCSMPGATFHDDVLGGGCKAKALVYITTRGFDIKDESELDGASFYLKALCWLWGIPSFHVVSADSMDMLSLEEGEKKLQEASEKAKALARSI